MVTGDWGQDMPVAHQVVPTPAPRVANICPRLVLWNSVFRVLRKDPVRLSRPRGSRFLCCALTPTSRSLGVALSIRPARRRSIREPSAREGDCELSAPWLVCHTSTRGSSLGPVPIARSRDRARAPQTDPLDARGARARARGGEGARPVNLNAKFSDRN